MADDDIKPLVVQGRAQLLRPVITQVLAMRQMLRGKDIGEMYTTPVLSFQSQFEFHPQVSLVFRQTLGEANRSSGATTDPEDMKKPVEGLISYRLMNETHETMNPDKAYTLAQKIKAKFAVPVCTWDKGITNYTYWDDPKGYKFRILAATEAEARRLIEMTLDLAGESPSWDLLREHIPKATYPVKPNKEFIYGKSKRPPRRRPVETVKFKYAEMHVWGVASAVTLVDVSGLRLNALVRN